MKMKPPVSSSPCANEQEERKAPVIQCGITGEPVDSCTKSAVTGHTQWNGQANTACEDGTMQVDNSELRQNGQVGTCPENGVERLSTNEVDVSSRQGTGPTASPENGVERLNANEVNVSSRQGTGPTASPENGVERLNANEVNVSSRQGTGPTASPENGVEQLNANEVDVSSRQGTGPADDAVAVGTGEDRQGDKEDVDSEYADEELPCDEDEDLDEQLEAAYSAGVTVDSTDNDNAPPEDWETEIVSPVFIVPHKAYLYGKKVFVPSDLHAPTARRRCPQFHAVQGQFDDADT